MIFKTMAAADVSADTGHSAFSGNSDRRTVKKNAFESEIQAWNKSGESPGLLCRQAA